MKRRPIAIVGAGPGGLAAGMLLAAQGFEVDIYEKNDRPGGRSSRLELGPYRFDRGATFLMMPQKWEELFRLAGRNVNDYVSLTMLDPMYRLQFGADSLDMTTVRTAMAAEIERLFPSESQGYLRFMDEEAVKFERIMPLLERPFNGWLDYAAGDVMRALPVLHATDTVYNRLSRYFRDERLRSSFCFQSKYLGMSPWECPGTFTMLSYLEHRYGLAHPQGGINRLIDAMASVVAEHGGRIHTNAPVRQVLVKNGRAVGLELEDGTRVDADDVIIGADFPYAADRLFAPGTLKKYSPERIARKKYSCSTYMLYLGLDRKFDMPHHTIVFAGDYRRNVDDLFKRARLSEEPSIYVHNPSALDPSMAPPGHSAVMVLVPVPNTEAPITWSEDEQVQFRSLVLDRLEAVPQLAGLSSAITMEQTFTPPDWRDRMNVYRGATFSLAHSIDQMLAFRPHNRFEEVDRCWLVGGGTHPGSGLPTILESAKITTAMLLHTSRSSRSSRAR